MNYFSGRVKDKMVNCGMAVRIRAYFNKLRRVVWHSRCWQKKLLLSADGIMLYTVRDRYGDEKQVYIPSRDEWVPISKVKFSNLECFEDYHREKFNTAVPKTGGV